MKCDSQDVEDPVYLYNSVRCLPVHLAGSTYPAYRNGRRNRRLSLRRHVRRRTFRDAYAKIAEPMDVSKPAECRNYSLRCTLCSGFSVHLFSFSPFSLECRPYAFAGARTLSLAPSVSSAPSLWAVSTFCISPIQLRQSHTSMR